MGLLLSSYHAYLFYKLFKHVHNLKFERFTCITDGPKNKVLIFTFSFLSYLTGGAWYTTNVLNNKKGYISFSCCFYLCGNVLIVVSNIVFLKSKKNNLVVLCVLLSELKLIKLLLHKQVTVDKQL